MVLYVTLSKGSMFGGKSTDLWMRYKQYELINANLINEGKNPLSILVIKPKIDNRYDIDHIITHDGKKIPCSYVEKLSEISIDKYDIILIDEAHWIYDLYEFISSNFYSKNTRIHIAGLNGTKDQKNFGDINKISPFCSEETRHYGMCIFCGGKAPFSRCKVDFDGETLVGSDNEYYTVCANHFHMTLTNDPRKDNKLFPKV